MFIKYFFRKNLMSIGQQAERMARRHLETQGLIFITQNYRCRRGEIDLIMRDKSTIVFVEVRYRSNNNHGSSAESVTVQKQQRVIMSAEHYLHKHTDLRRHSCRFDVVALCQDSKNPATLHINWIKHAFNAF